MEKIREDLIQIQKVIKRVVKKVLQEKEFSVLLRMIPSLSGFCHSDDLTAWKWFIYS